MNFILSIYVVVFELWKIECSISIFSVKTNNNVSRHFFVLLIVALYSHSTSIVITRKQAMLTHLHFINLYIAENKVELNKKGRELKTL